MEDQHLVCADLASARRWDFEDGGPLGSTALFAVFDGHGGDEAAVFVAENLPRVLSEQCPTLATLNLESVENRTVLANTLVSVFSSIDKAFLAMANDELLDQPILAGTTVLLMLLHSDRFITVANLGDSRAVLSRAGQAVDLSEDHKPSVPAERDRILASGGWITESLELDVSRLWRLNPRLLDAKTIPRELAGTEVGFVKVYRLNGELMVSRSIGDAETKGELKHEFWEDREFTADVMSCEPDVKTLERSAEDDFCILACDGLWDVFESQEAVDFLRQRLVFYKEQASTDRLVRSTEETPTGKKHSLLAGGLPDITRKASIDLVNEALTRGSQDNISVQVVILGKI